MSDQPREWFWLLKIIYPGKNRNYLQNKHIARSIYCDRLYSCIEVYALYSMPCIICIVFYLLVYMHCILYFVFCIWYTVIAFYALYDILCNIFYTLCSLDQFICIERSALRSINWILCIVFSMYHNPLISF
jgi:hypothetical protein